MNPILLRYVGFALAAVIAGAGGGYLAVNNKKVSPPPVTQSGTIPAIPAQPFPGQGIPAISAIPAAPGDHPTPPRGDAPVLTSIDNLSKCSYAGYRTTPEDAYCVPFFSDGFNLTDFYGRPWQSIWSGDKNIKPGISLRGYNFMPANNAILWDQNEVERVRSFYDETAVNFTFPSNQQLCSIHDVAVETRFGKSNNLQIKIIDPSISQFWFLSTDKKSAPVGADLYLQLQGDWATFKKYYSSSLLYAQFSKYSSPTPGASFLFAGEVMTPLTAVIPLPETDFYESVPYRITIPQEVNQCPTSIYPQCAGSRLENKMISLTPGFYGLRLIAVFKGQCSGYTSNDSVGFPAFTITEK